MPRKPRFILPGQPLHVIHRGNNRAAVFTREVDFEVFHDLFREACEKHDCVVYAYVYMTNHVHSVMSSHTGDGIGRVMQAVGRRYVPYFNRTNARTGGLWEGRFRRHRSTPIGTSSRATGTSN